MATALILMAPGCEELEAVTVVDLLRRAGIDVVTAGLDDKPVRASRGTVLLPDTTLDAALGREYDMIVLPGGQPGADNLDRDPRIPPLLRSMAADGKFTAAICAAPKVLAHAGLLRGRRATAFPGTLERVEGGDIQLLSDAVVTDGTVITSRGPGTAMDFALELIEVLGDRATRDRVEAALQRP